MKFKNAIQETELAKKKKKVWELEDGTFEITQSEEHKEKEWKCVETASVIPSTETIRTLGIPVGEETEKEAEHWFKEWPR